MILLDACVMLWLAADQARIPETVFNALDTEPAGFSAITAFEIGQKVARGKLNIDGPLEDWFARLCKVYELEIFPVNFETAVAATKLPPLHHDPFDRILIATAQTRKLTLVTPDTEIAKYPERSVLW